MAAPFCHIVIPAPDLHAAKRFYESVFGWTIRENEPGPGYWFFESGNVGGAFSASAAPSRGSTVLVVRVDDIDDAVRRVTAAGGTVLRPPSEIGKASAGRDAYFLDPNGNELGLYSA